jgi:hypothetical protein
VTYFDEQNVKIKAGALQGEEVVVSALMINKLSHRDSHGLRKMPNISYLAVGLTR